ncbi:MAG: aquaporin, partial [Candidatus Omnitrophota bacterium]
GGYISGAHYNPAVTLAVWLRGKCPAKDVPPYILAQAIGASLAAAVTLYFKKDVLVIPMKPDIP